MGFRTVVVKNRSKLDLRLNYLVCRGEQEIKVYIPEISYLILESTSISLTCALISELIKNNVKIIFCDEKHSPESELVALHSNYSSVSNIKNQMTWNNITKGEVWREIIKEKIKHQRNFLNELGKQDESLLLNEYLETVQFNDSTNREGHAAKVYFNAVFGKAFARHNSSQINKALNYGYSVLLSCFNREIVKLGYLTQLGIWHKNEFNFFNLSCDFMEPFRVLIDRIVYEMYLNGEKNLDYKSAILEIFNLQLKIDDKKQYFENAMQIYCQSLINALNCNDVRKIKFYEI